MLSVGISKLGLMTSSLSIRSKDQRRLLLRHAPVAAAVARHVRRFLYLSTRQHTGQATPTFILPDLWPPNSICLNPVDYKMWGNIQQQVYQSQLHSIDELTKCLLVFGTSWTKASLTMQLTSGVSIFKRVFRQKADILSNCYKADNSIVCGTVRQHIFRFIKHVICNLS